MSAQGGTLERRGAVQLPMWTIAALLAAAIAAAIGLTVFTDARPDGIVTSVTDDERLANSSAAVREQGGRVLFDPAVLENSSAAIREQGAFAYHASGRAHEVTVGAVTAGVTSISGLENPAAYGTDGTFRPKVGGHKPIMVNGEPCPQCR